MERISAGLTLFGNDPPAPLEALRMELATVRLPLHASHVPRHPQRAIRSTASCGMSRVYGVHSFHASCGPRILTCCAAAVELGRACSSHDLTVPDGRPTRPAHTPSSVTVDSALRTCAK